MPWSLKQLTAALFAALFSLILTAPLHASPTALEAERLDEQLEMLLPGNGQQDLSARAYARGQLHELFQRLEDNRVRRKAIHKALEIIIAEVEGSFLRHSGAFVPFANLFREGQYDQSTATAIYALVMEYFSIPYAIQMNEWQVNLLADPEGRPQVLGAPISRRQTRQRLANFKRSYLELLRSVALLDEEEWQRPEEELFRLYYFGNTDQLSLRELASYLHYRQALAAYDRRAFVEVLSWLEQAQGLSGRPLYAILQRATWLQLADEDETSRESLFYLWKVWEGSPGEPWQSELLRRFSKATVSEGDSVFGAARIDSIYHYFNDRFAGYGFAQQQLREMYYLKLARFHARHGHTESVTNYMDSLYLLRPQDLDVQNVLAGMLVWSLGSERDFTRGLQRIQEFSNRYPFLLNNELFQDQHLFYQAERIRYFFDRDEAATAANYLRDFDLLLQRFGRTPRMTSWVTTAYVAASNYYYRRGEFAYALHYVERSYALAPTDPYLEHRVDLLRNYYLR